MAKARSALRKQQIETKERAAKFDQSLAALRPVVQPKTAVQIGQEVFAAFPQYAVRDPKDFKRQIKTKSESTIRIIMADYVYGQYRVPKFLRNIWGIPLTATAGTRFGRPTRNAAGSTLGSFDIETAFRWHAIAASGRSLYKQETYIFLTKKETHFFLTCPFDLKFNEAIVYAIVKAVTNDIGIQTELARSKLNEKRLTDPFWKEVIQFFALAPATIETTFSSINDLVDYISNVKQEVPDWSIKGRTLHSLCVSMEQWHRTMARANKMGNATWEGFALKDVVYEGFDHGDKKLTWMMTQIKTSRSLAEEGSKMHHCVYSYQRGCIDQSLSIWSLQVSHGGRFGRFERALTLELKNNGDIVQVRGFANRLARKDETQVVKRWAAENGLCLR